MISNMLGRCAVASLALLAATVAAAAEPVTLKLAFFGSDRSSTYLAAIKPFVDAVNAEGKGLVEIQPYLSGTLGKEIAQQPQIVLDGKADLAFIVPGYTPELFPDNTVLELPGLFRNGTDATRVYTRLIAERALMGYRDFVVIGAYESEPETFHGRVSITSLQDIKGRRIRVNNAGETVALERLGAIPVPLQITAVSEALSSDAIDATLMARTPLADYGISRVATHHFLLTTSGAPLALVMNRKVFEGLPPAAQAIIQKYSGTYAAERFAELYAATDQKVMAQLRADPKRQIATPTTSEIKWADTVFKAVRAELASRDPHRQALLQAVENELGMLGPSD